jgi:glutaredoxin
MKIVLYKTTHCPRCIELKQRLETLQIDYEEKNVETDSEAMADVLMLGQWVMPVLTKDGELVDLDNLEKELET